MVSTATQTYDTLSEVCTNSIPGQRCLQHLYFMSVVVQLVDMAAPTWIV